MIDIQREMLNWAACQHPLTGLVILAMGLVFAFFGFRMFRFLLAVTCGAIGWGAGYLIAAYADTPALPICIGVSAALALISLKMVYLGLGIAAGTIWGGTGYYLCYQLHLPEPLTYLFAAVFAVLGLLFAMICHRQTSVTLSTLTGVILIIAGFVSVSSTLIPTLGNTFRSWAQAQSLVVPIFLGMLFAAAYSYQAMHQQGDIRTGR